MIWLWAWPVIGFLFGLYLVFSPKGGDRMDARQDGLVTDVGWLVLLTISGPIWPLLVVGVYLKLFFGCRE